MKQKLAVARTLLHRPDLVFLDEPTAGLDPVAAAALRDDLASISKREGATIFLTTHNLTEAEKLCDLVAVIRQGKLLAIGTPDSLRTRSGSDRLEIIGSGINEQALSQLRSRPEVVSVQQRNSHLNIEVKPDTETAPLVTLLVTAGVQIDEVRKGKASLEEVFLTLVEEEND